MSRQEGYSLTEILTTIVILAVLAGIAVPGFGRSREKAVANQGIAYLRTIRLGEKMYFSKNGTYVDNTNCASATCADATAIRTALGVELTTENFSFTITGISATTFTANAVRNGGAYTLTLNQNGTFDSSGTLPTGFVVPAA